MIKKAKITFQGHLKKVVRFTPGFNVITGDTDSGKSSIFRALNFALRNVTKRINYVPHSEKQAEVEVDINGHTVKRIKGSKNLYYLDDQELKAFGAGVPEVVEQVVNMDDLNVQPQHQQLFLISESGGNIAKYLNSLIDMSVIDRTLFKLNQMQSNAKKDVESVKKNLEYTEEQIAEYSYLDPADQALQRMLSIHGDIEKLETKADKLQGYMHDICLAEESLWSGMADAQEHFEKLEHLYCEIKEDEQAVEKIDGHMRQILADTVCPVDVGFNIVDKFQEIKELGKKKGTLACLVTDIKDANLRIKAAKKRIKIIRAELDEISYECDKCGSRVAL